MPRAPLPLSERSVCDLECITTGVYAPLEGFAGPDDHEAVVSTMHLASGSLWPIPVTLAVTREVAATIPLDAEVPLAHPDGRVLATMTVTSKYEPERVATARAVFGTEDPAHPGVRALFEAGEVCLGGPVRAVAEVPHAEFAAHRLTPARTRALFAERGWKTIAGFQTRNPIHRAHEHLTKVALESVDGLFVNPLVGSTRFDDVPAAVRMRAYQSLLSRYYPADRVLLGVYPAAMRYGGPREAVLHAISRRNYGCTHFLVGRDHAGVGSYYGPLDAQRIFDRIGEDELGIRILRFDNAFWCRACAAMATAKTCPHPASQHLSLSGTRVREMLAAGVRPPVQFTRPEVADILMEAFAGADRAGSEAGTGSGSSSAEQVGAAPAHAFRLADVPTPVAAPAPPGFTVWLTGLSGAGKTTLASLLEAELRGRAIPVEVLDGDVVRTNLSKGLGFSREDRDTNIRRIGFVADLLARNGVAVIVAAISPYRAVRDEVRARIGRFLEVHVDAPVEVCAERDTKGLYAKALAGEIRGFTGIDDPYEAPLSPEVHCPTAEDPPEVSLARILATLEQSGFVEPASIRSTTRS